MDGIISLICKSKSSSVNTPLRLRLARLTATHSSVISRHIVEGKCDIIYSTKPRSYHGKQAVELALELGEVGIDVGDDFGLDADPFITL
jgi:hypothetical protein